MGFVFPTNNLFVFPLRERGKEPLTEHGWKDATVDFDIIRDWWIRWPNANVGIACEPSNLVVLDLDSAEGIRIAKEKGLPAAPYVRTSKGFHVYYAADPNRPIPSMIKALPGIDIRALGGYVVAPPSIHPSGAQYSWVEGFSLSNMQLPAPPEWMFELKSDSHKTDISGLAQGALEGCRDVNLASVAGHLLRKYVDPHLAEALVYAYGRCLCDPPLSDKQIDKVWNSIASREFRRREQRGRS